MNIRKKLDHALEKAEELDEALKKIEELEICIEKLEAENRRHLKKIDALEDQQRFKSQFQQMMAARGSWGH